ncbi:autotransporter outer membrane beta-barrel domain-containing protein [Pragia fontium]|uniref:Autotransporter domain-containing protein n=1 Tax=Pragia fontium TaxID=82985 RepID=A0ABQ5LID5_9GAMM|nr:autotransporter outer membrane beta-barrel domain-containing protein [Pragia fontium]GKX62727.1 hypothetical protein SOASR032_12960 [Pragia fontium]
MKLNKLVLALPALFAVSLPAYSVEVPPEAFPSKVATPDVNAILNDSANTDGWPIASDKWANKNTSIITGNQYIHGKTFTRTWFPSSGIQSLDVSNNSYSLNNAIDSLQVTVNSGSVVIGSTVKGGIVDPNNGKVYNGILLMTGSTTAYDTVLEDRGQLTLSNSSKGYNTLVNAGGQLTLGSSSYAQANYINGGFMQMSVMSNVVAEDTIVINGGQQIIYGGTSINAHIGNGSYQLASGLSIDTTLYNGAFQRVYAGAGGDSVSDRNTTIYGGARQQLQVGISEGAHVYGVQVISAVDGDWRNGQWESDADLKLRGSNQVSKDAVIYAGGTQRIHTGSAENAQVYGLQIVSGKKGGWVGEEWVETDGWVGRDQIAKNATIFTGGEQRVGYYADAIGTVVDGGSQVAAELGHLQDTTVQNGGSSYIAYGAYSTGSLDVVDGSLTMQGGDAHAWTNASLGGKGAWARNVDLQSANSTLYIEHNANTSESTATVETLKMNDGSVVFGRQDGSDAGKYSRLDLISLSGNGTFVMNTNINGGQGDFLSISDPLDVNSRFNVKVMDSGVELKRSVAGVDPHHLIYANSSTAEHFTLLNGSVDLGAYKYYLVQGDDTDTDNWYLSPTAAPVEPTDPTDPGTPGDNGGGSVTPNPTPELSESAKSVIAMANVTPTIWDGELSTLRTRLGDLRDNRSAQNGTWGKYITSRYRVSTDNVGYKQDMNGVMLGGDRAIELEGSRLLIGGLFSYTHSKLDSRSGDGKVDSYGLGVYTTWMHDSGYYVDGVLKANRFKTENNANFNGGKTSGSDNTNGFGASVEVGKHIKLDSYFIEPYIMGSAFRGGKTSYELDSGMKAKADSAQSLKTEVGTTIGHAFVLDSGALLKPYVRLAVSHEFQKNNDVIINDTERFSNDMSGTVGKYGVGLTAQLDNQWSTYGEINYSNGSHIETPYSGHLGIRYSF